MSAKKKMPTPQLKLRKDSRKKEPYPVYLQVCIDRKKFRHPAGVVVAEKNWDSIKQRVKRAEPNQEELYCGPDRL